MNLSKRLVVGAIACLAVGVGSASLYAMGWPSVTGALALCSLAVSFYLTRTWFEAYIYEGSD